MTDLGSILWVYILSACPLNSLYGTSIKLFQVTKNHTIFAFCSHSYHDENPFNLSNCEFFFIVQLKGFPHVFAKIDEKNEKTIKEGAKNALSPRSNSTFAIDKYSMRMYTIR
jgi:hypothetical protein